MATILIDTNILVYAHDRGEHVKQQQSIRLLEALRPMGVVRLSAQCLAEFFRATTRGVHPILTTAQARQQIEALAYTWPVLDVTPRVVMEAARGVIDHQLAYWDAQIWASARLNQIPLVLSEDFTDGAVVEGVRFVNPLASAFDVGTLLA